MMKTTAAFSAFLLVLFVIAISDTSVRAELCEKASKTWSGNCGNTGHCDRQCQSWEKAAHGACHVRGGKHMCFCYFNCPLSEKLAQDTARAQEIAQEKAKAEKLAQDKFNPQKLDRDTKKVVPNVEHP